MKILLFITTILFLTSCISVQVDKHPDYNYPATYATKIIVYRMLKPTRNFKIIGRIKMEATVSFSRKQENNSMKAKAASIGGDAVWITSEKIDIQSYNIGTTTQGTVTVSGNTASYNQRSTSIVGGDEVLHLYGYVIKFIETKK